MISTTDLSHSKLIHHFVGMGFPEELVAKVIEENGNCSVTLPVLLSVKTMLMTIGKMRRRGKFRIYTRNFAYTFSE